MPADVLAMKEPGHVQVWCWFSLNQLSTTARQANIVKIAKFQKIDNVSNPAYTSYSIIIIINSWRIQHNSGNKKFIMRWNSYKIMWSFHITIYVNKTDPLSPNTKIILHLTLKLSDPRHKLYTWITGVNLTVFFSL